MTVWIVGIGNLLVGCAYLGMGILSAWEAASQYRYRGLSRFGLGFSLMAASCGPHHLVHGWCVLQGSMVPTPMMAVTLVGMPAGVTFCWLRAEALLGGRGDRTISLSLAHMIAIVVSGIVVVGVLAGLAMASPALPAGAICSTQSTPLGSLMVTLANIFVTFTYGMVGWYLAETQVRRYMTSRSFSLSGLALAAIFPTCAAMHLVLALTSGRGDATLIFDLIGVPASVYFLWIVKRLHMDSVVDWNRRPLVGVAAMPGRSAPWSDVPHVGHQ